MWATWVEVGRVMISMVIWVISLAGSIAAICLAVAMDAQTSHLGATALVSFGIVAAAVSDHRASDVAGGSEKALAANGARYLGVLWAWSAISANVAYAFLLDWPYWMPVVVCMFLACGVCFFMAWIMDREAASDAPDPLGLNLAELLPMSQLALGGLMLGALIALRRQPELSMGGANRWVAFNLIICTAAALLTLSGYLLTCRRAAIAEGDAGQANDKILDAAV